MGKGIDVRTDKHKGSKWKEEKKCMNVRHNIIALFVLTLMDHMLVCFMFLFPWPCPPWLLICDLALLQV
jgi:hypothetical protein